MSTIKLIVFDLDGVLVDTKNIHFNALNNALKKEKIKYEISYDEHLKIFDGLTTKEKLQILLKRKVLKKNNLKNIIKFKNIYTDAELKKSIKFNKKIYEIFKKLSKKYKVIVATNAIKKTLVTCIKKLKIQKYLFLSYSNQDVIFPKPHPQIYLKCMVDGGSKPKETLIIEDSHHGRQSALDSGGNLFPIKTDNDLTYKKIIETINFINKKNIMKKNTRWKDKELNILIPMAGAGKRFAEAGYSFPKPLIEIHGQPMIKWVVQSLNISANYIFLAQKSHIEKYNLQSVLKIIEPDCKIVEIDGLTEGAACTTLLAEKLIDNKKPLLIANSDQFIEWNASKSMYKFISKKADGGILTFEAIHPKWSYAKVDQNNKVLEVAEKKVISNNATVGIYYWKQGKDYVKYAKQMIKKNLRINNEFYVCPVFNEALKENKNILIDKIDKMWGIGTPEDLKYFIDNFKVK